MIVAERKLHQVRTSEQKAARMDQVCPRCKTTKYKNPNMKLMVNVCGHNICETCVELLFIMARLRLGLHR